MNSNNDVFFMDLAEKESKLSCCQNLKVGAIFVKNNRIITQSHNYNIYNINCTDEYDKCCRDKVGGCRDAIHAEQDVINKIISDNISKKDIINCTLYVTHSPCIVCAKLLKLLQISRVVYKYSYAKYKGLEEDEGVNLLKNFCDIVWLKD